MSCRHAILALTLATSAACATSNDPTRAAAVAKPACAPPVTLTSASPVPEPWTASPLPSPHALTAPSALPETDEVDAAPAPFADRRADEALDRIADLVTMRSSARGRVIRLGTDSLFGAGQCTLTDDSHLLVDIASALREQGDRSIAVESYTDRLDPPSADLAISKCRADAVRDYLVAHGVNAAHLSAKGLGAEHPLTDNRTADGRAANRRVEIVIGRGNAAPEENAR